VEGRVDGAAALAELVRSAGSVVALTGAGISVASGIVTQGPTPWDDRAAIKLDGDVEHELRALLAAL